LFCFNGFIIHTYESFLTDFLIMYWNCSEWKVDC
jgi:hypothetical protein